MYMLIKQNYRQIKLTNKHHAKYVCNKYWRVLLYIELFQHPGGTSGKDVDRVSEMAQIQPEMSLPLRTCALSNFGEVYVLQLKTYRKNSVFFTDGVQHVLYT